jgi:hypothetical protein
MNDRDDAQQLAAFEGLCATCRQARPTVSDRGTRFIRCERAKIDPAYPKYPRLPVLTCLGHAPTAVE